MQLQQVATAWHWDAHVGFEVVNSNFKAPGLSTDQWQAGCVLRTVTQLNRIDLASCTRRKGPGGGDVLRRGGGWRSTGAGTAVTDCCVL